MRTEWAILADSNRARIFARVGGSNWQLIRDLTRAFNGSSGNGNGREVRLPDGLRRMHPAIEHSSDLAERLAKELSSARKRGDFDALVVIAPADFLESLQSALDAATRRKLTATAAGNLTGLPLKEARREIARRF